MDIQRCSAKLKQNYWPYGRSSQSCQNAVWKDGYCKIHHPDEKRRRQRQRDERREELFNSKKLTKNNGQ